MKILFFTRRFWPEIGGVEKHCLEVGRVLTQKGHKVTVVTELPLDKKLSLNDEIDGIRVFRIPIVASAKGKKFVIWKWLLKNKKIMEDSDVIHCHDVFYWYLPFKFLFWNKKVFVTFHGWEGFYPPRISAKIIRKISEIFSNGNICIGKYIEKWYGTKANLVSYGAVKIEKKFDVKKFDMLFIGRLEKDTGLPVFLNAIEKLAKKRTKVIFLGDGSLKKEAGEVGEVIGAVDNVQDYIRASKFVLTSGYLSILEAQLNKKLVFATFDNPLKRDYLKMSPFKDKIIIEESPDALSKKIDFFWKNKKKAERKIEISYNWAKTQTWEKLVEKYLNLWKR